MASQCGVLLWSLEPGDVHWGLVEPVVPSCVGGVQSGNGPLESVAPGDLHWGLVVPMVLQYTFKSKSGNGPFVSVALGIHIGAGRAHVPTMPGRAHGSTMHFQ